MSRSQLIHGVHSVRHVLLQSPEAVLELWLQRGRCGGLVSEIRALAARHDIRIQEVPAKTLDKLVPNVRHQGIVLRRRPVRLSDERDLTTLLRRDGLPLLLLVLDGVQDPRNLGACLRTAEAAGADAVIVPVHRGVGLTDTVSKVASGAAEWIPLVAVRNLARALQAIKAAGVLLVGTVRDATRSVYELELTRPTAFVMGSEDRGLRRLTRENCEQLARIPMYGRVESFNVSVATGICLYEAVRQRRKAFDVTESGLSVNDA